MIHFILIFLKLKMYSELMMINTGAQINKI